MQAVPANEAFDDAFFPLPGYRIETERLCDEIAQLVVSAPLAFSRTPQLALHSFPGSTDPWHDGCRTQRDIGEDSDYTLLHPDLHGSYLEKIFASLPFTPFRARLMGLDPAVCYSVHRDSTPRYHIAVHSTPQACFVFVDRMKAVHIPTDGNIYFVDTRESHTAFNGGPDRRLHIVFGGPVIRRNGEGIRIDR